MKNILKGDFTLPRKITAREADYDFFQGRVNSTYGYKEGGCTPHRHKDVHPPPPFQK